MEFDRDVPARLCRSSTGNQALIGRDKGEATLEHRMMGQGGQELCSRFDRAALNCDVLREHAPHLALVAGDEIALAGDFLLYSAQRKLAGATLVV